MLATTTRECHDLRTGSWCVMELLAHLFGDGVPFNDAAPGDTLDVQTAGQDHPDKFAESLKEHEEPCAS